MAPNSAVHLHFTCCQSTSLSNKVAELRVTMVAIKRHSLRFMCIRSATVDFAPKPPLVFSKHDGTQCNFRQARWLSEEQIYYSKGTT